MLALYRAGRQADALAAYRRAHLTFVGEVGVEPGVSLRELQRAILLQDPALDDGGQQIGWTLERAAAILPRDEPERARTLLDYGMALWQLGERRRAASTLRAAERVAHDAREPALEARAQLALSFFACYQDGRSPLDHLAEAERVAGVCERHHDDDGLAFALGEQAFMLAVSGRVDDAAAVVERAIDIAGSTGNRWLEASGRGLLAQCLADGSMPVEEAIARCDELLRRIAPDAELVPKVLAALGVLHAEAGRLDEGRVLVERSLIRVREAGTTWHVVAMLGLAGRVELAAGAHAEAAARFRTAYALLEAEDDRGALATYGAALACVLARIDEIGEADRLARAVRATASSPDDFYTEVLWRSALALVAAHEGRADEAVRLSDEALARSNASDVLTFRGQTLEEAAIVRSFTGDEPGRRRALADALALYERKGCVARAARAEVRARGSLDPAAEREHVRDERLALPVHAALPHRLRALVPRREREPQVAVPLAQQVREQPHAHLHVPVDRRAVDALHEQHALHELHRHGEELQDAAGAGGRDDVALEPGLLPRERARELRIDAVVRRPAVERAADDVLRSGGRCRRGRDRRHAEPRPDQQEAARIELVRPCERGDRGAEARRQGGQVVAGAHDVRRPPTPADEAGARGVVCAAVDGRRPALTSPSRPEPEPRPDEQYRRRVEAVRAGERGHRRPEALCDRGQVLAGADDVDPRRPAAASRPGRPGPPVPRASRPGDPVGDEPVRALERLDGRGVRGSRTPPWARPSRTRGRGAGTGAPTRRSRRRPARGRACRATGGRAARAPRASAGPRARRPRGPYEPGRASPPRPCPARRRRRPPRVDAVCLQRDLQTLRPGGSRLRARPAPAESARTTREPSAVHLDPTG